MQLPIRTNVTGLKHDELLLLDFLFDKSCTQAHLTMDNYSVHMNCEYSHGLDDKELSEALASLCGRGLLHSQGQPICSIGDQSYKLEQLYTMTEAGGALWEKEREPQWERFVSTSKWQLGVNCRGMMRIIAISEDIGRLCMGTMFAAGQILPASRIRVRTLWDARLLPWKTFPRVHSIRCKISDNLADEVLPKNWNFYNSGRCWWRDIEELNCLKRV